MSANSCSCRCSSALRQPKRFFASAPPHDDSNSMQTPTQSAPSQDSEDDPWAYLYGNVPDESPAPTPNVRLQKRGIQHRMANASKFDYTTNTFPKPASSPSSSTSSSRTSSSAFSSSDRDSRHREKVPMRNFTGFTNDQTISEREREIFEGIFDAILSTRGPDAFNMPPSRTANKFQPSPTIAKLFESALGPQKFGNEVSFGPMGKSHDSSAASVTAAMTRASATPSYPPSLRAAAAHAAGLSTPALSQAEKAKETERLAQLAMLIDQLHACSTDLDVLTFADRHVFSMITNPPPPPPAPFPQDGDNGNSKSSSSSFSWTIPSANYPTLLQQTMRLLRTTYHDYPSIISLFERTKRLGAESYVIGCSTSVYNEMLRTRWEGYRDLQAVNELLVEMKVNGVARDVETLVVIEEIRYDVRRYRVDSSLRGAGLLWGGRGTDEWVGQLAEEAEELSL